MNHQDEYVVGRALCGAVRRFLREMQMRGATITWEEGPGWLDRMFVIRGDAETLRTIRQHLSQVSL